jgi:hypothetical protein
LHEAGYVAWEKIGTEAAGLFMGVVKADTGNGRFVKLQTKLGVVRCSAPMTLERALEGVRIGTPIEIKYVRQEPAKEKEKAGLKRFEVYAVEEKEA